ncbi:DUF1697 domain-containing protein [Blastococcus sp. SYSU DS1024]
MMRRYAALLRGIAPANPLMANAELREVLTRLGYANVRSVLSSGNLLFEASDASTRRLEVAIEEAMQRHLGRPCATFVLTRRRLERLAGVDVFAGHDDVGDRRCMVTLLARTPADAPRLPYEQDGSVVLSLREGALFSVVDMTRPPTVLRWIEAEYGATTTRSWRSLQRIAAALPRDG